MPLSPPARPYLNDADMPSTSCNPEAAPAELVGDTASTLSVLAEEQDERFGTVGRK